MERLEKELAMVKKIGEKYDELNPIDDKDGNLVKRSLDDALTEILTKEAERLGCKITEEESKKAPGWYPGVLLNSGLHYLMCEIFTD